VSYFYGTLPVFTHDAKDVKSFRMFTSQLYLEGKVTQSTLVKVFGVSAISIKQAVKLYEKAGAGGFWRPRADPGALGLDGGSAPASTRTVRSRAELAGGGGRFGSQV
jgi:hypothetical protein